MSLGAGVRLGPYEVVSLLGAGGMGEVYRARDDRLGREVAIKVLPAAFATDHERMVRFQREARVLASLNHPHIASIYGFEESNSTRALVMELVEGPTLDQRIAQGAIPIEEALPIARQIAEALEYAHECGIVHRDLKSANVKLTLDGAVKVLDFGLAKALSDDPLSPDVSNSPTFSAIATRAGTILGTAAYMSPEQAKGKPADRRADIWSFGVVLYEMLTGRRPFSGETSQETLAAVLRAEPDWSALPANVLRRACGGCCGGASTRIRGGASRRSRRRGSRSKTRSVAPPTRRRPARPSAVHALAPGSAVGSWSRWLWRWRWSCPCGAAAAREPAPSTSVRLSVELGADASLTTGSGPARSSRPTARCWPLPRRSRRPDARRLRAPARTASGFPACGDRRRSQSVLLARWSVARLLRRGQAQEGRRNGRRGRDLCDAPDDRGGSLERGRFDPLHASGPRGLSRVSSAGGTAEVLTTPDPAAGETSHRWPQALPGGNAVLFTVGSAAAISRARASSCSRCPKARGSALQRGGYHGRYLRSGHIVYIHEGTLFAAPFDLERLGADGTARARARRRRRRPANRGGAVRVLGPRHAGVPAGIERRGRRADPMDGRAREDRAPPSAPRQLLATSISLPTAEGSRWTLYSDTEAGRVGLRVGTRHDVPPDFRSART